MITRENLTKLRELTNEVQHQALVASDLLKTAQDRFNQVVHKLTRDEKEIELSEKVLWDEVFFLGPECQAGKILKEAHPEVFEAFKAQEEMSTKLKAFTTSELGVDYTQMTISNYLDLTEAMFKMLIEEAKA